MDRYDDIIHLPHHRSKHHPPMSMADRAAQFSPFAALTGHADAIRETARLTDRRIELSGDEKERLNEKLQIVRAAAGTDAVFTFTYFVPDTRKAGGAYISRTGSVKRAEETEGVLRLRDGTAIPLREIAEIEGSSFEAFGIDT